MYKVNHAWLYGAVKPFFESVGINLIRDDMIFIKDCLGCIPPESHRKMMRDYLDVWATSVVKNNNVECMHVNARYEANTFLRVNTLEKAVNV